MEVTMEVQPHPNKKFMARFERYEPVIMDHTAMITAKKCLKMYFYQIVLGRVTKDEAIYFAWGSSYHKFREVLEKEYGFGSNKPPKFDENKALDAFTKAVNAGLMYWRAKGKDQTAEDKFSWMTAPRLFKSFQVAFEHWKREKQRGVIEVIAVEQPFNVQLADGSHRSGRADQIIRWMNKPWGRDFKTSSKEGAFYARSLEPNEQFSGYTFAEAQLTGENIQGQIVEVLFNAKATKNKENGPEIFELTASRNKWQLEQWEKDHIFWNQILTKARNEDHYPMTEAQCPFCPYHSVCKQSNEASMMYQLETSFKVRPWDNTKIGETDL